MLSLDAIVAPLVTPFTDDASTVSEVRVARLVRWMLDGGCRAISVCADVGEWRMLGNSERKTLLEYVVREAHGAAHVFAHVSACGTAAALDLAQHAKRHGARAAILAPPEVPGLTEYEVAMHLKRVSQYADLPVIAVDPTGQLAEVGEDSILAKSGVEMASELQSVRNPLLTIAERPTSDEFALDRLWSTPLASIVPGLTPETDPAGEPNLVEIAMLMRECGAARFLKCALPLIDLDVGPNRSPYQHLPPVLAQKVRDLAERWPR